MKYSKNKRAKKIVGLRKLPSNAIPIDIPSELGYHCPVCKYKLISSGLDGKYDERLEWSEYNTFLWCKGCNTDYPSVMCMPDIDKAIEIYLDVVESMINNTIKWDVKKGKLKGFIDNKG